MIKSILGIDPVAIGAALLALIAMIGGIFFRGVKAGKDSQKAKLAKAQLKSAEDQLEMHRDADEIERQNAALADERAREKAKRIIQ